MTIQSTDHVSHSHQAEPAGSACPSFAAAMDVIGRRWNGIIVQAIGQDSATFSEVGRFVGHIGDTMLAKRLRELESDGLIVRTVTGGRPVGVVYSLTGRGRDLLPILDQITHWGHAHAMADTADTAGIDAVITKTTKTRDN